MAFLYQADVRVDAVEVKIKKLDAELTRYRDQLKKMREGPAKVKRNTIEAYIKY